ncbi:TetR family transcriptional regulator [Thermomonospora curvata]|uniref:TetR family transcriptional regulator n=1 Tax=Thermomonospora curvata TaxID=2020 RepID=UPI0009FC1FF0
MAETAGHSIGSLYQYFPNKDAILAEPATAHVWAGIATMRRRLEEPLPESLGTRSACSSGRLATATATIPACAVSCSERRCGRPSCCGCCARSRSGRWRVVTGLLESGPRVQAAGSSLAAGIESLVCWVISREELRSLTLVGRR